MSGRFYHAAPGRSQGPEANALRAGLIGRKNISQPLAALTREDERLGSELTLIDLSFPRGQGKRHPGAERCGVVTAETARRGNGRRFVDVSLGG
jgi:hypothetical protein